MIRINKADKEIIEILKEVFQLKRINPMKSDENLRLWIIRSFFIVSIIALIIKVIYFLSDNKTDSISSEIVNTPIAFFLLYFFFISIINLKIQA